MSRIDGTFATGHLNTEAGMAYGPAGSLGGEQVAMAKDPVSALSDAREEISMAHSEKAESKQFEDREIAGESPVQLMHIDQIQSYLEATHRFKDPRALANLVKLMQSSPNPRGVAQQAARAPAQQFALLQLALADAGKNEMPIDVLERLQDALGDLQLEKGAEIRVGLNTVHAAGEFAPSADGIENFQQTYTDIVLGQASFAAVLMVVLKRLAGAQGEAFERGLLSLLQALGADLSATRSSTDPVRLQTLVQDIYQMQVASSVLEGCRQLSQSIAERFGGTGVVPLELMTELVALINERCVSPQRLRTLEGKFRVAALLERIAFHAGTKGLLGKMPVQVFTDADARASLLETAQKVLDDAVAEEEEGQGA